MLVYKALNCHAPGYKRYDDPLSNSMLFAVLPEFVVDCSTISAEVKRLCFLCEILKFEHFFKKQLKIVGFWWILFFY